MNKKNTRALASATVLSLVLTTAVTTANVKAAKGEATRIGGADRYVTAANVATSNWEKSDKVILASGEGYADSLSASVLSKKLDAPIILTQSKELNENAKAAIKKLGAKEVYVIGGNASVSEATRKELKDSGKKLVELGGKTRFETNLAIANYLADDLDVDASNVLVVNGKEGFSDALSVAPVAAAKGQILLIVSTDAKDAKLASDFVAKHKSKVTVVGTENVVPKSVYEMLKASERVDGGNNRFETNINILNHFNIKGDKLYAANATGAGYADALVGSALAGKFGAPLVLTDTKDSKDTAKAVKYIKDHATKDTDLQVLGGEGVMPKEVVDAINDAVKPEAELAIKSVNVITDSKINVNLSKAVDSAKAENFSIKGATVNSATLSADKTSVTLDVKGLEVGKDYTVKVSGLKSNAVEQAELSKDFKMPKSESLFTPEVSLKDNSLKADGQSSTLVTFTLRDANGKVMKDAEKVEVAFTTTFGRLAEKRVSVQNGVATVLFTSETLKSQKNANITATVVEAANKNLIGLEAKRSLLLDPNPADGDDEKVGATMTEAQAEQADRVVVYFNKDVSPAKYCKEDGTIDKEKAEVKVYSNVNNDGKDGKEVSVAGILPVQGNSKALELVLNENENLKDNANVKVSFNDKTGTVDVPRSKTFKLTDARKPAMLSVERQGLKQLKVVFSESLQKETAQNLKNWVIDGISLDNAAYGSNAKAKAEVGEFTKGKDTRNVVTITLGENAKGEQIYFKAGDHSIQASNIGDRANVTDKGNNIMNTQTFDFDVPVDKTAPNAKVEVQSPEQYIVTFDKELNEDASSKIELQVYNKDDQKWENTDKSLIKVQRIGTSSSYKVEITKDWTKTYNTNGTKENYYNDKYRLVIAKDSVTSAANGVKNASMSLSLDGAMKTPDLVSPIINKIEKIDGKVSYKVTMSEPIKGYDGLETVAQNQGQLPAPTAQFIKKDGTKTVTAKVEKGTDAYDKTITVSPIQELEAGEWTVVVRSISDDIGNTAASATKDFTVKAKPSVEDNFKVVWSFADSDQDLTDVNNVKDEAKAVKDGKDDCVYVKFNKAIAVSGDSKNPLKTSNYQLDGQPLPTGTKILANIAGLDDKDKVSDSVTIVLPDGTLNGKDKTHVITISDSLESSKAGDKLQNGGTKTITWSATEGLFNQLLEAEKTVYEAEDAKNVDKLNAAKTKVNALDDSVLGKKSLQSRLDVVNKEIESAKKTK